MTFLSSTHSSSMFRELRQHLDVGRRPSRGGASEEPRPGTRRSGSRRSHLRISSRRRLRRRGGPVHHPARRAAGGGRRHGVRVPVVVQDEGSRGTPPPPPATPRLPRTPPHPRWRHRRKYRDGKNQGRGFSERGGGGVRRGRRPPRRTEAVPRGTAGTRGSCPNIFDATARATTTPPRGQLRARASQRQLLHETDCVVEERHEERRGADASTGASCIHAVRITAVRGAGTPSRPQLSFPRQRGTERRRGLSSAAAKISGRVAAATPRFRRGAWRPVQLRKRRA